MTPAKPTLAAPTPAEPTPTDQVEARLWDALRHVEDPEVLVSVVGMGLIVSLAYRPQTRHAGWRSRSPRWAAPRWRFIEQDIREALLNDPDVDEVEIEVVWDPVWTKDRIRADARATMQRLGIVT